MVSFFKKIFDEPFLKQKEELEKLVIKFSLTMKIKPGVDQIDGAYGKFGLDMTNPIPVNGAIGELKYLAKLYCSCEVAQIAHRLGSIWSDELQRSLDVYELVCLNGKHWNLFYFDLHYDRRSLKFPAGYKSNQYSEPVDIWPIISVVNSYVNYFPILLPNHVRPDFKSTIIIDPRKTYTDTMEIENCQAAAMVELRSSMDNELVRKSTNGLGKILIDKQLLFVKPDQLNVKIKFLMERISSQMKASKDENNIRYYG
jgi:hypothetical protein